MKNNFLILLAFVSVMTASSCKRKVETCMLGKCYITDGITSPQPNTFHYYEDGRLKKITYSNSTWDTLSYAGDTLTIQSYDYRDTILVATFTGMLNPQGFVTEGTKELYNFLGTVTGTETYLLEYSAEGNLTMRTVSGSLGTEILSMHYTGGNADSATLVVDTVPAKKYYFYHSSAENKTGISDLNEVFSPYFGKPSKGLLDSVHIFLGSDTNAVRIQYTHELDLNDYVGKSTQTYLAPGVQTRYFTYQYFGCD